LIGFKETSVSLAGQTINLVTHSMFSVNYVYGAYLRLDPKDDASNSISVDCPLSIWTIILLTLVVVLK
jgi:hypothetical protein